MEKQARVGVGVMIFKENKILLGKRLNSYGEGLWSFPGGRLEYLESLEGCARREVKEECDIIIKDLELLCVIDKEVNAPSHYITIIFKAFWDKLEPQICEPDKCEGWEWFELDNLPKGIFSLTQLGIDAFIKNKKYFKE